MRLTQVFVARPTLVTVVLSLVALAGALAYATIVNQNFPNIDFPTIQVRLSYPGGSTTEIRDAIVRPVEDAIAGAPDLDHLSTTIQQGQASIAATFTLGSDKTTDLVEIQRRVQTAQGNLPTDLTAPSVSTFDPSEATVATLVVTSASLAPAALSALVTNDIAPEIEQTGGIANVNASGALTPAIEVNVDPRKLDAAGLTLGDLVTAIGSDNVRAPGGVVYGPNRETNVDIRGDVSDVATVANLLVAGASGTGAISSSGPSGQSSKNASGTQASALASGSAASGLNAWSFAQRNVRVADFASVVDGAERQRVYSYVGASPAITLNVQKASGASEIDASKSVLAVLPKLRREYPAVNFDVLNVQADYTQQQINGVWKTLTLGIMFTGIVMLLFLRSWRNAVVVMIAIPTSLLVTLVVMKLVNFTIDTISLLAMTLIIGILVDDSIVILENTERHYDDGEVPRTAAILGRRELGASAIVITLVDVVVFLPIAFLPGVIGRFLAEFALVVVVATLTSLFVSFTITPSLSGNWSLLSTWKPWPVVDAFTRAFERVRTFYLTRVLEWAFAHPGSIFGGSTLLTLGAFALVPLGAIGFEFIPAVDRGEVFISITYPTGTPLTTTDSAVTKLGAEVARLADVKSVTSVSGASQSSFGGPQNLGSTGQLHVFLKDKPQHTTFWWATRFGVLGRAAAPGAEIVSIPATGTGGGNAQPVDMVVESLDDQPEKYAPAIVAALKATPGTAHVSSSINNLAPQVDLVFDRERARALDLDIGTAANAARAAFGGALATQFDTSRGIKYVQVTYPQSAQTDVRSLLEISVRARNGSLVRVGDVARLVQDPAQPLMTRTNRQTVIHVSANLAPGAALSTVLDAFHKRLAGLHLPAGVSVLANPGGQQQNLGDTVSGLGQTLVLSFALVYLLMVALYDSYRLPFIIMFAVPVAAVGALGSLALTHLTLNLFSLIGTVLLVGLVSKNGILLVDFANHRVRAGLDRVAAMREAARERFRPIVMTTCSMIAGMMPIALALDPGSSVRQALGVVVIGGLTSSLLLTLVLVPVGFVKFAPVYHPRRTPASGTGLESTRALEVSSR